MGLLEGYFVPLYNFFLTPENFDQKVKYDVTKYKKTQQPHTHFALVTCTQNIMKQNNC